MRDERSSHRSVLARLWERASPSRLALIVWIVVAAAMLIGKWAAIRDLATIDPDDALRLVQVRDLLAGQAWWDVMQHRINPAAGGGLMHWSRIVDTPLAGFIALLTPLVGQGVAERIVAALWPVTMLGVTFMLAGRLLERFGDRLFVLVGLLLLAVNYVILVQFMPLRIDHHGWQIMLSLVVLLAALMRPGVRSGVTAGVAGAAYLAISIEGLPVLALFAALFGLVWAWQGQSVHRDRLFAYLGSLAVSVVVLQYITRGPAALVQHWCDALSLPYLAALVCAAVALPGLGWCAARLVPGRWGRLCALALAGALSGATLLLIEPSCARGPFAALDPIVVTYWYANVLEGLPIWHATGPLIGFMMAPTLVGLAGIVLAWRSEAEAERKADWAVLLVAAGGAWLVSVMVLRAASSAQLFALPGCVWVGLKLWRWARAIPSAGPRIAASLLAAIAVPPVAGVAAGWPLSQVVAGNHGGFANGLETRPDHGACVDPVSLAALNRLGPQIVFAPLDIGPHILQNSPHSVIATGHHRNNAAIATIIRTFIGSSDAAQARVRATGAQMVAICIASSEFDNFRATPGGSFADDLAGGRVPDWLAPVPMGRGANLKVWRVVPPASRPAA